MHSGLTHRTVLLREAVRALEVRSDGVYIDATFGRGGHSSAILDALSPTGRVLAIDRDLEAEQFARRHFQEDDRFSFVRASYGQLAIIAQERGLEGCVQGILLDMGVSSPQLDDPERGFSFTKEGTLDMRMDQTSAMSAAEWLNLARETEISQVIKEFGEERFHRRIARGIVEARRKRPLETTVQLANIIAASVPTRERRKHPATRSFQAIRIFINQELKELESALAQALQVLAPDGRLVVISFHSLEDRLVKRFMRDQARGFEMPLDLPLLASQTGATLRVIGKAVRPSEQEREGNPRSRSAVMRVAERLP